MDDPCCNHCLTKMEKMKDWEGEWWYCPECLRTKTISVQSKKSKIET